MSLKDPLISELQFESISTRKMLERTPLEKADWKPHEKSMTLGRLSAHVAEIPSWVVHTLSADELNFKTDEWKPVVFTNNKDMLEFFDKNVADAKKALEETTDEMMYKNWALKMDGNVLFQMPKIQVLRTWAFNHLVHHRAQLSVYLRLNDIPLPSTYGPSADENR
jgi:uncharacterized damage-inducible protein DinB